MKKLRTSELKLCLSSYFKALIISKKQSADARKHIGEKPEPSRRYLYRGPGPFGTWFLPLTAALIATTS